MSSSVSSITPEYVRSGPKRGICVSACVPLLSETTIREVPKPYPNPEAGESERLKHGLRPREIQSRRQRAQHERSGESNVCQSIDGTSTTNAATASTPEPSVKRNGVPVSSPHADTLARIIAKTNEQSAPSTSSPPNPTLTQDRPRSTPPLSTRTASNKLKAAAFAAAVSTDTTANTATDASSLIPRSGDTNPPPTFLIRGSIRSAEAPRLRVDYAVARREVHPGAHGKRICGLRATDAKCETRS
jgi:hypothetical protein